jgi:hypothetical protein
MDQSQLLSLIGSLYDKLVTDVAERVQSQLSLGPVTDVLVEAIDARIEAALDNHCDQYDHDEYDNVVNELSNYELGDFLLHENVHEAVAEAVKDLTFTVSVE